MSNQKHDEELDMNELTELTPFSLDVYKTRGNFPSSKIITGGHCNLGIASGIKPNLSKLTCAKAQ
jgi:hypothetical protein